MLNQGLVSYLYQYLQQGYDVNSLRSHLYQQGYQIQDIDEAIRYLQYYYPQAFVQRFTSANQPLQVHHQHSVSPKTLFFIFLLLFLVPIAGYLIFQLIPGSIPNQLMDITTTPLSSKVRPGEKVTFELMLENFGSDRRVDASIISSMHTPEGRMVTETRYVQAVETKSSKTVQMTVPPGSSPGLYSVLTLVYYSGIEEQASFTFEVGEETVNQKPTCYDGIRNQGEEGIDCGGPCEKACGPVQPSCFDGIRNQGEIKTDCGGPCPPCEVSCQNCIPQSPCTDAKCVNNRCVFTPRVPCCGNFICEEGESWDGSSGEKCVADCKKPRDAGDSPEAIAREAVKLAETDPEGAAQACNTLESGRTKDICFTDVSKVARIVNLCLNIEAPHLKDGCYMNAAMQGDFSGCAKIADTHLSTSCRQLSQFATIEIPDSVDLEGYAAGTGLDR